MREAWEQEWQAVDVDGKTQKKTFMAAAARLGVGVFGSAPLLEGELLKDEALRVSHRLPYTRTHPHIFGLDLSRGDYNHVSSMIVAAMLHEFV